MKGGLSPGALASCGRYASLWSLNLTGRMPAVPVPWLDPWDMGDAAIQFRATREIPVENVIALYRAVGWSAAEKPEVLGKALAGSHSLISAWDGEKLVGLGNALSDGHLVVYYSHLLVQPDYQGRGIGTRLMQILTARYQGFHQHVLIADGRAIDFFRKCGFRRAGKTEPMWIYAGHDH